MQKNEIVIFPHLAPFCQALSHIMLYKNCYHGYVVWKAEIKFKGKA